MMKDFPLNDLLSATELDKIRQALVAIFTHLRKNRTLHKRLKVDAVLGGLGCALITIYRTCMFCPLSRF